MAARAVRMIGVYVFACFAVVLASTVLLSDMVRSLESELQEQEDRMRK